jgi:phosphatidylserine/phosphatidylglycerophosphate/cardiolipin synthase-like enzyme
MDDIEVSFLCEGCQTAASVGEKLVKFIGQATSSIEMTAYSFHLCPEEHDMLAEALKERAAAGVSVRIAYDAGSQQAAIPDPGHYFCDPNTPHFVAALGFPSKAIEGYRALMHDKYVVLDAMTANGQVWTGSTNFTDDSWTSQENNILVLRSETIAALYRNDFDELWNDGNIASSGIGDSGEATLHYKGQPAFTLVNFAPGEGEWIDESLAKLIDRTTNRLTLAFVVLTSSAIIKALQGLMSRKVPIDGVYDWAQMEGVKYQWSLVPENNWKIGAFEEIVRYGGLVGKKSTPYTPTSKHDYMHNKVMVLDNITVTGSYNFSRHAQRNAENILVIECDPLADTYREYIEGLKQRIVANVSEAAQQAPTTPPAPNT